MSRPIPTILLDLENLHSLYKHLRVLSSAKFCIDSGSESSSFYIDAHREDLNNILKAKEVHLIQELSEAGGPVIEPRIFKL